MYVKLLNLYRVPGDQAREKASRLAHCGGAAAAGTHVMLYVPAAPPLTSYQVLGNGGAWVPEGNTAS
ncbi:hypothetical protein JYU34_003045 [Plutella xylostella]|uniref:Uncharacterized protein n=1 Tax=Plutella xylostella TaxID=51655 RepID=A0ABQ7QZ16_PLUXY|nr:hypothetical protein JYU34_003045 [Plutella xylostella]